MKTTPWREIRDRRVGNDPARVERAREALQAAEGWSEEQAQHAPQAAEEEPEPNGEGATVLEEDSRPTFEESLDILASIDFPPREDAWR
jgi:hypothetical protein